MDFQRFQQGLIVTVGEAAEVVQHVPFTDLVLEFQNEVGVVIENNSFGIKGNGNSLDACLQSGNRAQEQDDDKDRYGSDHDGSDILRMQN